MPPPPIRQTATTQFPSQMPKPHLGDNSDKSHGVTGPHCSKFLRPEQHNHKPPRPPIPFSLNSPMGSTFTAFRPLSTLGG